MRRYSSLHVIFPQNEFVTSDRLRLFTNCVLKRQKKVIQMPKTLKADEKMCRSLNSSLVIIGHRFCPTSSGQENAEA